MSLGPILPLAIVVAKPMDDSFGANLILISIPLLVLGVVAALLYRIGTEPRREANK